MKTSLLVAHELGLSPDAVLDCAARHLGFHDFASFASAIHGASRAYGCCARRDILSATDVAYIKTLAARVDSDRNVLAFMPTLRSLDLQNHLEASAQVYEKVAAAVQALKDDVQRAFSQGDALSDRVFEDASGFARALTAIMSDDDSARAYERAVTAILHVRFAVPYALADDDADDAGRQPGVAPHRDAVKLPAAASGWMERVKDAVSHPGRLHK